MTTSVNIVEGVQQQAGKTPDAIAVAAGTEGITYAALEGRSNSLADRLRLLGVGPDILVALCLPRSIDMVVGALGILKAGGAYVPIDPACPPERMTFMLRDAKPAAVIADSSVAQRLPASGPQQILAESFRSEEFSRAPEIEIKPSDLAYVIYTSGSTGAPKGVEITHSSLMNLVAWHLRAFAVTSSDRASHLAGLGFDAAVWELWPYLAVGASVHLADEVTRDSAELLRDWLLDRGITISFVPTPIAEQILALPWPRNTRLRTLLTGGDLLHGYPPPGLPFELINNYGPTECAVVATSGRIPPMALSESLPPIGEEITNTEIYLLDEQLNPVADGTAGEMYIAGPGLARGYHNRPELTAERFISNPFSGQAGSRLYRTGDLARRLPDGQIAFLGRIDEQIKIRGYRIEPNEIVVALNRHPSVRASVVVAREDTPGEKRLVAYLVLKDEGSLSPSDLRDFLRDYLPEYMLPALFVRLEEYPVTPHGKVDRAALPAPDPGNTMVDQAVAEPRTAVEARVTQLLAALLERPAVEPDDNFFLLGGHSLMGAQLIAKIKQEFGVEISLRALFQAPTAASLAAEIEVMVAKKSVAAEKIGATAGCSTAPSCA